MKYIYIFFLVTLLSFVAKPKYKTRCNCVINLKEYGYDPTKPQNPERNMIMMEKAINKAISLGGCAIFTPYK